jgi:hypothetical protein
MRAMRRTTTAAAMLGVGVWLAAHGQVAAAPAAEAAGPPAAPPVTEAGAKPDAVPTAVPTTPRGEAPAPAASPSEPTFAEQDRYTTPRPTAPGVPPDRRWRIRQAPLAGAEPSWGPPGQVPEYAELEGPEPAPKGPPPRGTARIVTGAILGPVGLGLTIVGIVGATTRMLGDHKQLSVPIIGAGLVTTAVGCALLADGILRRQRFMRWQAGQSRVSLRPEAVPGRFAGATLVWRF